MTEYRLRDAARASGDPGPAHANDRNHPHWFCAELREILSPYPEAFRRVCEWLAELEARGHIPAD